MITIAEIIIKENQYEALSSNMIELTEYEVDIIEKLAIDNQVFIVDIIKASIKEYLSNSKYLHK